MRPLSVVGFGLPVVCVLLSSGCSRRPATLTKDYDEVEMAAAIQEARKSFDDFRRRLQDPQSGDDNFAIKVKIEDENGVEHFWLNNVEVHGDRYMGVIANDPGIVKKVKSGDKYSFTLDDVSDWMYMSKGVMQGNYTLRVLLRSMPKDEADALRKHIGW